MQYAICALSEVKGSCNLGVWRPADSWRIGIAAELPSRAESPKQAAFYGQGVARGSANAKAIDAVFTDPLRFDQSQLDLVGLDLILKDLANLTVKNGQLMAGLVR
jgi:hypothetical protein